MKLADDKRNRRHRDMRATNRAICSPLGASGFAITPKIRLAVCSQFHQEIESSMAMT
jgi:hypothetical protein